MSLIISIKTAEGFVMAADSRVSMHVQHKGEAPQKPLTGGISSTAATLDEIIEETLSAVSSERTSRVIDKEEAGSMERRKREGYF